MRTATMTVLMIGLLIAGRGPASAITPTVRCEAQKVKAAGDYADCRLMAAQRAIRQSKPADFSRCEALFSARWQQLEDQNGAACLTVGDEMDIQFAVDECTDTLATALSGGGFPPPPGCQAFPATGQRLQFVFNDDGAIEAGATLHYIDNGDGTLTDTNTGLIWEKKIKRDTLRDAANLNDADNQYPWHGSCSVTTATICGTDPDCPMGETCAAGDSQAPSPNGLTIFEWVQALNVANFAGHNDWRVPNVKELQSILDYSTANPSVHPAFNGVSCGTACTDLADPACSCTVASRYWSATTYTVNPTFAWRVNYFDGGVGAIDKTDMLFVRAVRGGL